MSLSPVVGVIVAPGREYKIELSAGETLAISQVEGAQAVDLVAVIPGSAPDYLSMWMSCAVNRVWKLTKGHVLISHGGRTMFTIVADTCGENYSGGGYCNSALNARWHGAPDDPSCERNLKTALDALGVDASPLTGDACLNLFMKVDYESDGAWTIRESPAQPGDCVQLLAETDVGVAISNCPATRTRTNAGCTHSIRVSVKPSIDLRGASGARS